MNKTQTIGDKNPLFLRYINKETSVTDLLLTLSRMNDKKTSEAATRLLNEVPDLEEFHKELTDAVNDLVKDGVSEEFKAFVNHYLESLEEDLETKDTKFGENRTQTARIKNEEGPWLQGFICYNLCLYIKTFGMENLKRCRVCGKLFAHKGKWAVYCSDPCKNKKDVVQKQ